MTKYPLHLTKLINVFKKLPGVGNKSAERFAFQLLTWPDEQIREMASILQQTKQQLKNCPQCGCLTDDESCRLCDIEQRHSQVICIVAYSKDVFAIEQTQEFKGLYQVLGNLLSPLDGKGPELIPISPLKARIATFGIQEVIIALDSTLEGDATALYIKQQLAPMNLSISRLAFGIPMGSALDYVDGGTLARAMRGRSHF